MAYERGVGGWSYSAQQSCNNIAIVCAMQAGGGNKRMIELVHQRLEVKEYLVKVTY